MELADLPNLRLPKLNPAEALSLIVSIRKDRAFILQHSSSINDITPPADDIENTLDEIGEEQEAVTDLVKQIPRKAINRKQAKQTISDEEIIKHLHNDLLLEGFVDLGLCTKDDIDRLKKATSADGNQE